MTEKDEQTKTHLLGDASFILKLTSKAPHAISFEVYEVIAWAQEPSTGLFTKIDETQLYLTGTIKWDGCSHIWFGEEEGGKQVGYLHLCGKSTWDRHIKLMQEIFEFAAQNIERFDHDIAS